MWLRPVHAFAVLAPLLASAVDWQRTRLRKGPPPAAGKSEWDDMKCFIDLARFGLTATQDSVMFRSGHATKDGMPEVLVVEDQSKSTKAPRRTLVFRSADGKCNEQAGTVCAGKAENLSRGAADASGFGTSALGSDAELMSIGGAATEDKCSTLACSADVEATLKEPGAGYIRSMVGATTLLPSMPDAKRQFLSIGLGAGTMALVLQHTFPGSRQTVVELSPDVAAAAQCFGAGVDSGLDVVTGDGRAYLEGAADASFDAVFVDAFDAADKVPSCFTTSEFFGAAKRKLRPGGILVMNAHTGITLHNDVKDLLPAAHAAFGGGSGLQVGKAPGLANAIVLAQVEDGGKLAAGAFAQGTNDELNSWFNDALFAQVEVPKDQVLTDAAVQCGGR